MKFIFYTLVFFFVTTIVQAQVEPKQGVPMGYVLTERDSILSDTIQLPEIIISKGEIDKEAEKQFLILENRVYKTYPYAKMAAERLVALNKGMERLTSSREKKRYFKIVEDYLTNSFEAKLKKLSRKQGQILVKLIHRQTGVTSYDLIKNLKSGWKAFWANGTANLFDISLKEKYSPYEVNEDYLIESILVRAFQSGRLVKQNAAHPVDYHKLCDYWEDLAEKKAAEKKAAKAEQ